MLFWITWIIGNLVYVKTYHAQNPFQVLDHDYTKLSFLTPDWYPRAHYPKARFSISPRQFNLTHTFSFNWATWTTLRQKDQNSPNLSKTLSFDKNNLNHFGPKKALSKQYRSPSSRYPPTIKVPNLNKKKKNEWMKKKELWSFYHAFGIFE